jgi:hypothetical protein
VILSQEDIDKFNCPYEIDCRIETNLNTERSMYSDLMRQCYVLHNSIATQNTRIDLSIKNMSVTLNFTYIGYLDNKDLSLLTIENIVAWFEKDFLAQFNNINFILTSIKW